MEDQPEIVPLTSPDRDNVRHEFSILPVIANWDRQDTQVISFIPDLVGCYGCQEMLDQILNLLLRLFND